MLLFCIFNVIENKHRAYSQTTNYKYKSCAWTLNNCVHFNSFLKYSELSNDMRNSPAPEILFTKNAKTNKTNAVIVSEPVLVYTCWISLKLMQQQSTGQVDPPISSAHMPRLYDPGIALPQKTMLISWPWLSQDINGPFFKRVWLLHWYCFYYYYYHHYLQQCWHYRDLRLCNRLPVLDCCCYNYCCSFIY